jgi:hypothetical protein
VKLIKSSLISGHLSVLIFLRGRERERERESSVYSEEEEARRSLM